MSRLNLLFKRYMTVDVYPVIGATGAAMGLVVYFLNSKTGDPSFAIRKEDRLSYDEQFRQVEKANLSGFSKFGQTARHLAPWGGIGKSKHDYDAGPLVEKLKAVPMTIETEDEEEEEEEEEEVAAVEEAEEEAAVEAADEAPAAVEAEAVAAEAVEAEAVETEAVEAEAVEAEAVAEAVAEAPAAEAVEAVESETPVPEVTAVETDGEAKSE